jgi:hypothetical protein
VEEAIGKIPDPMRIQLLLLAKGASFTPSQD